MGRIATLLLAALFALPAQAENYRSIAIPNTTARGRALRERIQDRLFSGKTVRPLSQAARARLVNAPGNADAMARGRDLLKGLAGKARSGGIKRGIRRGYGSRDFEYRGSGLAKQLGLSKGQSIAWNTRGARHEVKVESHSRVVWTIRRHDVYASRLRSALGKIVARVARDPSVELSARDQRVLATAPTDMRAEALARHGLKLKRVESGRKGNLKYKLHVPGSRLPLFTKVFGPGVSTYLPGKGHSMYVHKGLVWETFRYHGTNELRPTSKTIYPVMLKDAEARNMDLLAKDMGRSYGDGVQGRLMGRGRPPGWPLAPGQTKTGNTCTTTHHRAPVGKRLPEMKWIDQLSKVVAQKARAGGIQIKLPREHGLAGLFHQLVGRASADNPLARKPLLEVLTDMRPGARIEILDQLARTPGLSAADRANVGKLRTIVEQYNRTLPGFPLQLVGRAPLKNMMGVPFDPKRPGTTDPVGPGFAKGMYSGAPARIPVLVKLEK